MRPASNTSSGEPAEVPDIEVDAHLGDPGQDYQARGPSSPMLMPPVLRLRLSLTATSISSTGTASTTVLEADAPRPSIVCRVRNCMAPGLSAIVLAADA